MMRSTLRLAAFTGRSTKDKEAAKTTRAQLNSQTLIYIPSARHFITTWNGPSRRSRDKSSPSSRNSSLSQIPKGLKRIAKERLGSLLTRNRNPRKKVNLAPSKDFNPLSAQRNLLIPQNQCVRRSQLLAAKAKPKRSSPPNPTVSSALTKRTPTPSVPSTNTASRAALAHCPAPTSSPKRTRKA